MANRPLPSSLVIQVHKGPRAYQTTVDSDPILWTSISSAPDGERTEAISSPCRVCHKHLARYKCPKCFMEYCSSGCYQHHKTTDGSNCTEAFFKDRVWQVLSLENSAKRDDFCRMLQRVHVDQKRATDANSHEHGTLCSQKELLELLDALDEGDEQDISAFLHRRPEVRAAVDSSLRRGDLSEWLLVPWHPWWRTELSHASDIEEETEELLDDEGDGRMMLDERLLEIPPFSSLRPKGSNIPPQLCFNALEILLAVVSTLHLFHGRDNAMELSLEASQCLCELSHVLTHDLRYDGVQEALHAFSEAITQLQMPFDAILIFRDVAIIVDNRRYIGRALLEANDILAAAILESKDKAAKKLLQKCQRKMQYYQSWSMDNATACLGSIAGEIHAWLADRTHHPSAVAEPLSSVLLVAESPGDRVGGSKLIKELVST